MKIYTGRGDQGQTSLFGGERVGKDSPRVDVYGALDELNAVLAAAQAFCQDPRVHEILFRLQNSLFAAGADLATRESRQTRITRIQEEDWRRLEAEIDDLQTHLPPLEEFILPSGLAGAALLHLARAVCRRAERLLVALMRQDSGVNPQLLIYLNRLSDLLFVMARFENHRRGGREELWQKKG